MEKIKKCYICNEPTPNGVYNVKQNYVCRSCLNTYLNLYVDDFIIEDGEVKNKVPLSDLDEQQQREVCIQFAYTLFNQKLATRSYSLFSTYRNKKKYTWLGMIRALEWFYIVRHNDLSKAKNSIGIIPYVYEDAQKYYAATNLKIKEKYKTQIVPIRQQQEVVEIEISRKAKKNAIDLGGL